MTEQPMTDDEARQFAEATLLDVVRGDMGDFRLTIAREDGRYRIELQPADEDEPAEYVGGSFAEAWLNGDTASAPRRGPLTVIKGGKD